MYYTKIVQIWFCSIEMQNWDEMNWNTRMLLRHFRVQQFMLLSTMSMAEMIFFDLRKRQIPDFHHFD